MSITLHHIPERTIRPRNNGLTMVMDKGLSINQVQDMLNTCHPYIDMVKLGFGTAYVTPNLDEKLSFYKSNGIAVYFGGTLFEAFVHRGQFDDYVRAIEKYKMQYVEVSDGSIDMEHDVKLDYIRRLSKYATVISEVGSKDNSHIIPPYVWLRMMKAELEAGAWKVIAEARESGTSGIYMNSGEARDGLVEEILSEIKPEDVLWEAPQKVQQEYFINKLGCNVNLGNIAPTDVIPLETLRLGLRSDTFYNFLPEDLKRKKK